MTKLKIFTNFDKEEKWLGKMAEQGYQLKSVSSCYNFYSTQPERVIFKIDYRTFKNDQDFLDYCTLFEDSGWQHIAGTKRSGSQYFKKTSPEGDEDIFSDLLSRAGRYKRVSDMWLSLSIAWLPFLVIMLTSDWIKMDGFLNPKTLYLTPGLWEMEGFDFWRRFLFETPFALLRGFSLFFWITIVLLYASFAIKSWWLYRKTLNENKSISL
ncbi:hypothetical protein HNQ56_003968 [Anaerotaenia torta]|uniref:DUF2812 domain-containing protein n=1 Tax=Anaerotaenia torta TaxID=433293 RepID=UPI003D25CDBC